MSNKLHASSEQSQQSSPGFFNQLRIAAESRGAARKFGRNMQTMVTGVPFEQGPETAKTFQRIYQFEAVDNDKPAATLKLTYLKGKEEPVAVSLASKHPVSSISIDSSTGQQDGTVPQFLYREINYPVTGRHVDIEGKRGLEVAHDYIVRADLPTRAAAMRPAANPAA